MYEKQYDGTRYIYIVLVGTPASALTAVERCQCATAWHILHEISSSYARFLCRSRHYS